MQKKGPTIKDVAAHAGVSVMAVSRVCNAKGPGQVSEAMRAKVTKAIEELGYEPDIVARALRRRRSDTVGFYNGYRGLLLVDDDFPRAIFTGLQDRSTELAQDLLIFNVPEQAISPEEVVRELSTSRVDGVVFLPREGDEALTRLLGESHQNVVAIGEAYAGLPAITAQDAPGSRLLARHLFDRGHRHILYRRAPSNLLSARRRYDAFADATAEVGMSLTTTVTTLHHDELDEVEREIIKRRKLLGITAIVGWHDFSAFQAVVYCRECGIGIPDDLAIAGFDGLTPRICPPGVRLTTIIVDWSDIAGRAVEYVVNGPGKVARPGDLTIDRDGVPEICVDGVLYIGNTT